MFKIICKCGNQIKIGNSKLPIEKEEIEIKSIIIGLQDDIREIDTDITCKKCGNYITLEDLL